MGRERDTVVGTLSTASAFALWGLAPLYWKLLEAVPADEVLAHRIVWSLPCLAALLSLGRGWVELRQAVASRRTALTLIVTTCLIGGNWLTFIWAVSTDHVLDVSLGYYINPLVSVALGFAFLAERLRRPQWLALALAAGGVTILTSRQGLPWISLALAFSFGLYGLLRKVVEVRAVAGLAVEVAILAPMGLGYLLHLEILGAGAFGSSGAGRALLLAASGPVTIVPLILVTHGARRLTLTSIGFLQYLAPTGHFVLALAVFGVPFSATHLASFVCIWAALGLYSLDLRRSLAPRHGR